ncbi:MAG: signal peptidase I [Acidobacteria bacterium]|nr:signal peptidase I [Acidobacteriota bacterium]
MKRHAFKLVLSLPLLFASGGCDAGRRVYYASTHQIVRVPTGNMEPTIKPGDSAAVDLGYYSEHPVQRFDLVTFKLARENISPEMLGMDETTVYLKRVVGLGGETLEIKRGSVYIDGRALDEPFTAVPFFENEKFGPVKIPEGEYFLMGDNRPNSLDGRYWARPSLKKQQLLGKVVKIFPQ